VLGEAVVDVWYGYPDAANPAAWPSRLPFHTLSNVVTTPHMAGRTSGTVERRWQDIIANLGRLAELEAASIVQRRKLPPPAASCVYELTPCGATSSRSSARSAVGPRVRRKCCRAGR
jgi:hypothetical protein